MMPKHLFRLDRQAFGNAISACQGQHVAAVVGTVGSASSDELTWYAADVQVVGPAFVARRDPIPVHIGDTATMARLAAAVDQFESGVLVAVSRERTIPQFRTGGLWTEDEDTSDIGDAVAEIRAFDTTYILVATNDGKIAMRVDALATPRS